MNDAIAAEERIAKLEEQLTAVWERLAEAEYEIQALKQLRGCDQCGVVFVTADAYGEHVCLGRQGR